MGGSSILEAVVAFGEILMILLGTIFLCFHAYNETIVQVEELRLLVNEESTAEKIQSETAALLTGKGKIFLQKNSGILREQVSCSASWENPLYRLFRKQEMHMEQERERFSLFEPDYLRIKYWGNKEDETENNSLE